MSHFNCSSFEVNGKTSTTSRFIDLKYFWLVYKLLHYIIICTTSKDLFEVLGLDVETLKTGEVGVLRL